MPTLSSEVRDSYQRGYGSRATFGSTIDISRGGLEAVVQGPQIPVRSRCIVRFLSTTRIKPVMVWGVVTGVDQSTGGRVLRIEFETPLESLKLAPRAVEQKTSANVLVVDDDPLVRELLEQFLTEQGYCVQSVHDGPDTLSRRQSDEKSACVDRAAS